MINNLNDIEQEIRILLNNIIIGDENVIKQSLKKFDAYIFSSRVRGFVSKYKKDDRVFLLNWSISQFDSLDTNKRKASYISALGKLVKILGWNSDKEYFDFITKHIVDPAPTIRNSIVLMSNSNSLIMFSKDKLKKHENEILSFFTELKSLVNKYEYEYEENTSIDKLRPSIIKSLYLLYENFNYIDDLNTFFNANKHLKIKVPSRSFEPDFYEESIKKYDELSADLPESLWVKYPQKIQSIAYMEDLYNSAISQLEKCLDLFGLSKKSIKIIIDTVKSGKIKKEDYLPILGDCMRSDGLEFDQDKNHYAFLAMLRNFTYVERNIIHYNSKNEVYSYIIIDILSSRIYYEKQQPKDSNSLIFVLKSCHEKIEYVKNELIKKEYGFFNRVPKISSDKINFEKHKYNYENDYSGICENINACTLAAHDAIDWYLTREPAHSISKTPNQLAFIAFEVVRVVNDQFNRFELPFNDYIKDILPDLGNSNFISRFTSEVVFQEMENPKLYLFDFTKEYEIKEISSKIKWHIGYINAKKILTNLVNKLSIKYNIDDLLIEIYLDEPGGKSFDNINEIILSQIKNSSLLDNSIRDITECWNCMPRRYLFDKSPDQMINEYKDFSDSFDSKSSKKDTRSPYF